MYCNCDYLLRFYNITCFRNISHVKDRLKHCSNHIIKDEGVTASIYNSFGYFSLSSVNNFDTYLTCKLLITRMKLVNAVVLNHCINGGRLIGKLSVPVGISITVNSDAGNG